MADIACTKFTDFLSRKAEHLDDRIITSMHPIDSQWVGHVSTGRWKAEDGVEHTFDRFENVFPNLTGTWEDVTAASCVGKPCDPDMTAIGLGFSRDSYKLQRKAFKTDLFCFDQILSADRAKQQFAHVIKTLRRCSTIINSHRMRTEALRIAKYKWAPANNTLVPITATWNANMTVLTVSTLPTSMLTARHLQRRVQPQIRNGALGEEVNKGEGSQPMLELVTAMDEIWRIVEGSPELSDHWRFNDWDSAERTKFHKYGWSGKLGNYALRDDSYCLRFRILRQNGDGSWDLEVVFPYDNVAATEGIKEDVNDAWDTADVQIDFIWHRMAMTSMVRDSTQINPEMPFMMRDFAGKWMFSMNNLTCIDPTTGNLIPVDNSWGNKGRFQTMFSYGTQAQHPELAEAFIVLREPACIADAPPCKARDSGYPRQNYDSANAPCLAAAVVLTITPNINTGTGGYDVPDNSILCNGMPIFHDAITGATTVTLLVAQLNSKLAALGTWAVSGGNITLTTTVCSSVDIPFTESL